jgi:transcriptional regulator with XRE-family HTH domain
MGVLSETDREQKLDAPPDDKVFRELRRTIADLLQVRGWDQKTLAEKSALSEGTITKVLAGDTRLKVLTLLKLARGLEVPAAILLMQPRVKLR